MLDMSVVSSIGFDRDDEFFAMGGVTKYVEPARSKKPDLYLGGDLVMLSTDHYYYLLL